jgi:hypothetical protein
MARQRLGGLLRHFSRDLAFEVDYRAIRAAVQKTIDKVYATILYEEESLSAKYFLVHHGVYSMVQKNPNTDFILKATYPNCGKLCFTFGTNLGG